MLLYAVLEEQVTDFMSSYWSAIESRVEKSHGSLNSDASFAELPPPIGDSLTNLVQIMGILWNGSDIRDKELLEKLYNETIDKILGFLKSLCLHPFHVVQRNPVYEMVIAHLAVLHNFCHNLGSKINDLRQRDTLQTMHKFRSKDLSDQMKTMSLLVSSYLITEDSSKPEITLGKEEITYVIGLLGDAVESKDHKGRRGESNAYHADELLKGIINISTVEDNKGTLAECGVLLILVKAMGVQSESIQLRAVKVVWSLAFDEKVRQRIKSETVHAAGLEDRFPPSACFPPTSV